jgi:O-acetyl-ADP-ribose deacetylase
MTAVEIVEGDITSEETDAIVNAANSSLLGGGGVDGAIHRASGPTLLAECRRIRTERYPEGLPTGHAVATRGGALRAHWVIHTVGPVYGSSSNPAVELTACHVASLVVADEIGAKSIAFPAISTGAYGYPLDEAARVALNAVRSARTSVERVRFVLFGIQAYRTFAEAWKHLE